MQTNPRKPERARTIDEKCSRSFGRLATLCAGAGLWGLVPSTAYAYIDPGSGSVLLQMALAAIVGCLFYVRSAWRRIKRLLFRMKSRGKDALDR